MTSPATRRFALLVLVFGLVVPRAVLAETATVADDIHQGTRIFDYVMGRPRLETMFRQGRAMDAALHLQPDCTTDLRVALKSLILIAPIEMPEDRTAPVAGRWEFRYDLIRCGVPKNYSIIFAARPDGDAVAIAAFPGNSIASPQLIRDALLMMSANAHAPPEIPRDCKSQTLADTHVDQPPHTVTEGSKTFPSVWNETWTFDVCGQTVAVPVEFVPTADGGANFHVQMKAVHLVPH